MTFARISWSRPIKLNATPGASFSNVTQRHQRPSTSCPSPELDRPNTRLTVNWG